MWDMDNFELELDAQNAALESMLAEFGDEPDIATEGCVKSECVTKMLDNLRARLDACTSDSERSELVIKIQSEIDKFNEALNTMKDAAIKFKDDNDKESLVATISPVIANLKKVCNVISCKDIDSNTDSITDGEIQTLHNFLKEAQEMINDDYSAIESYDSLYDDFDDYDYAEESIGTKITEIKDTIINWFNGMIEKFKGMFNKEKDPNKKKIFAKIIAFFKRGKSSVENADSAEECKDIKDETMKKVETLQLEMHELEGDKADSTTSSRSDARQDDVPPSRSTQSAPTRSTSEVRKLSAGSTRNAARIGEKSKSVTPTVIHMGTKDNGSTQPKVVFDEKLYSPYNNRNKRVLREETLRMGRTQRIGKKADPLGLPYRPNREERRAARAEDRYNNRTVGEFKGPGKAYVGGRGRKRHRKPRRPGTNFVTQFESWIDYDDPDLLAIDMAFESYYGEGNYVGDYIGDDFDIVEEGLNDAWMELNKRIREWFSKMKEKFSKKASKEKDPEKKKIFTRCLLIIKKGESKANSAQSAEECKEAKEETQEEIERVTGEIGNIVDGEWVPITESLLGYDIYDEMVDMAFEEYYDIEDEYLMACEAYGYDEYDDYDDDYDYAEEAFERIAPKLSLASTIKSGRKAKALKAMVKEGRAAKKAGDYKKALALFTKAKKGYHDLLKTAKNIPDEMAVGKYNDGSDTVKGNSKIQAIQWCNNQIAVCDAFIIKIKDGAYGRASESYDYDYAEESYYDDYDLDYDYI